MVILGVSGWVSFGPESGVLEGGFQWLCDPCVNGGLADLMPFLGFLLFLCMVRVVALCGHQKQCLGGHDFGFRKRSYT